MAPRPARAGPQGPYSQQGPSPRREPVPWQLPPRPLPPEAPGQAGGSRHQRSRPEPRSPAPRRAHRGRQGPRQPEGEAASVSTTNPAQGEDFKWTKGTSRPQILTLPRMFAALGSPAPPLGASGQASELAPSTTAALFPPAPAKTEYGLSLSAVVGGVLWCVCAVLCPP